MASLGHNELIHKQNILTHWGQVMHICVCELTIIGSDNGLFPGRHQAIIWTIYGILLIGPMGTNFREILIQIYNFSFKKMLSGKWQPSCLGLNVSANQNTKSSFTVGGNQRSLRAHQSGWCSVCHFVYLSVPIYQSHFIVCGHFLENQCSNQF